MRNFTLIFFFFNLIFFQLQAQGPEITSWNLNTTNATGYGGILADIQSVCYDANYVYITATGVPSYSIGPWTNPNTPSDQNWGFQIPRNPQEETGAKTSLGLGQMGVLLSGPVIYSPSDGISYNNQGIWEQDAWDSEGATMDAAAGHNDASGIYHTHAAPNEMYSDDSTAHSPIIGYAFDGFPVYGPYGYDNPLDPGSPVVRMQSGYKLRSIGMRVSLPDGSMLPPAQHGPPINATYPLGIYIQDYEHDSTYGHLDEYNGRFAITPEYPAGTYAYFTTLEADHSTPAFPYFFGPYEFYGVVETSNTVPGGHVTAPVGCTPYTGSILPLDLTHFVGVREEVNLVHLDWAVAQEEAYSSFQVERMLEGEADFRAVSPVFPAKQLQYDFEDLNQEQVNSYYRLKYQQADGQVEYSEVVAVAGIQKDQHVQLFPNPVRNTLRILLDSGESTDLSISVYNQQGQRVLELTVWYESGQLVDLNEVEALPAGLYVLRLQLGGNSLTERFVKG